MLATDLTPEQITDSWRTYDCDYCQQTLNHRCRTKAGAICPPHVNRRLKYAAYLDGQTSRQPEVDELNRAIGVADATVSDLTAGLTAITTERDSLKTDLAAANTEISGLNDQNAALTKNLAVTTAERDTLQKKLDEVTAPPPPPEPRVLYEDAPVRRIKLPANQRGGGAGSNASYALSETADDITVTYEFMFEGAFDWRKAGKLPGPVAVLPGVSPTLATGGKEFGDKACSGRLMWMAPDGGTWTLTDGTKRKGVAPAEGIGYPYHPGQADDFGDNVWTGFALTAAQWISAECRYVMNTPGKTDGLFAISFDGGHQVSIPFVWRTRDDLHWSHFLRSVFPGGGNDTYTAPVDRFISIRNIRVTTPA